MTWAAWCLALGTGLGAQGVGQPGQPPTQPAAGPPAPTPAQPPVEGSARPGPATKVRIPTPDRVFLDGVMMTVDDQVILFSEVRGDFESARIGRLNNGETLTPLQERQMYRDIRFTHQRRAVLSRAALSLQDTNPEQIKDYVDRLLHDTQQERIKEYGSLNKMKDEMSLLGNSTFMIERKQREEILYRLAQQQMDIRLRDRAALMITPAMLRDRYRKVHESRRSAARTDLGLLLFSAGQGTDAQAIMAKATEAAAAWRAATLSSQEVATRFGAQALPDKTGLTDANAKNLQGFVLAFIAEAKTGDVSAPVTHGQGIWVLKVLARHPGFAYRFDDPAVQDQLRRELLQEEVQKIQLNAVRRDWEKVFIWESRQGPRPAEPGARSIGR